MFEDKTFDSILAEMLNQVPNTFDKRAGSIIYLALAPVAFELAETYFLLQNYVDLFYLDTATEEYLDRKVADFGYTRKVATTATRKIVASGSIPIGSVWSISDTTYVVTSLLSGTSYKAVCEQSGIIGNVYSGTLTLVSGTTNSTAVLADILIPGSDIESDTDLRSRIKQYLINPAQDGNVAQYEKWATTFSGIGRAKVFPLWNGGNTVKVSITNSDFLAASPTLVENFQEYLDPNSEGLGNGVAPCGSRVTVASGVTKNIAISATATLSEGYTTPEGAEEAVVEYLASITFVKNSVSYMRVGSALLDCDSIADITDLKINGGIQDIVLVDSEIPTLTSFVLGGS